jgi:5-(carboxyamino)imidazole ribonucleotide synthase
MLLFELENDTYVLDLVKLKQDCLQSSRGDLMDFETVYNFGKSGCINFEIELNLDALLKLEAES